MYFRLSKEIYAGKWDKDVIILDVRNDKYFSLTDQAAELFQASLSSEFHSSENMFTPVGKLDIDAEPEMLNSMISHFLERGFIEKSEVKESSKSINSPLKLGGLADYKWDYKSALAPFSKTSKIAIFRALRTLFKVNSLLKKRGIAGVMEAIDKGFDSRKKYIVPSESELAELSDSVDVACAFYPKKVYCLGWAATFVLLSLKRGWKCNLAIGVQAVPFYAHAWAECEGTVINDEPIVQEYLTVLLREPFS